MSMIEKTPLEVLRLYPPHDGTLWGLVESRISVRGDHPFLWCDGAELNWGTFHQRVLSVVRLLLMNNVHGGDRIGVMASNSIDYVVILFATAAVGAIFIPINPGLTQDETQYIVGHAKPALFFGAEEATGVLRRSCEAMGHSSIILSLAEGLDSLIAALPGTPTNADFLDDWNRPGADDVGLILYTSGTTGTPKGVMHSQRSMVMAGEYFIERMHLQPEDRLLCILPFFHINGLFYSLLGAAAAGAALLIAGRFSASTFWSLAARSGATEVNIIAAVGRILIRRPRSEFVPTHKIRKVYGAPIPEDVYEIFQKEFGIPTLIEGYGLTEAPGLCSNPFAGPHRIGSMGIPTRHPDPTVPYAEMKIVQGDDINLGSGEVGELLVRTPILMKGYYRDTEATRGAFTDGWFRTGDLVQQGDDGFYMFVARQKDIIRRRGENVSGAEIDEIVGRHPDVQVAAAIAVESELGEDEILVAVMRRVGAKLTERDLYEWCKQYLSAFKLPRYIVFVDSFPYTPSHRVAKFQLRKDETLKERAIDFM